MIAEPTLLRISQSTTKASFQFWLLSVFLVLVFFTGGASRVDVQSLLILWPLSVVTCAVSLTTLDRKHLQGRGLLFGGFVAIFALMAIYVVPLPPSLWHGLSGRALLAEIDRVAVLGNEWRSLTLAPMNGWHSLVSLLAPLAVFLLGIQLSRDDLYRLLPLLLGLGALSGLFGLLQAIGSPEGPLFFYRITNSGSAVGLFANRNHAALLLACLFPLLAVFASKSDSSSEQQNGRLLLAASSAIVLVPLVLVTGSRSGMLLSAAGVFTAALLYHRPAKRREESRARIGAAPIFLGLMVICLGFLTIFFSRAEAIDRLFEQSAIEDIRGDFWIVSLDLFRRYFPLGSGSGSFVETYQIAEPLRLLNANYLNRAHNDWIELAVTFGVLGILLSAVIMASYLRRSFNLWRHYSGSRQSVNFSRTAGIAIAMIAVASVSDYPLRTPTMMCVMAIFTLWFLESGREKQK